MVFFVVVCFLTTSLDMSKRRQRDTLTSLRPHSHLLQSQDSNPGKLGGEPMLLTLHCEDAAQ